MEGKVAYIFSQELIDECNKIPVLRGRVSITLELPARARSSVVGWLVLDHWTKSFFSKYESTERC